MMKHLALIALITLTSTLMVTAMAQTSRPAKNEPADAKNPATSPAGAAASNVAKDDQYNPAKSDNLKVPLKRLPDPEFVYKKTEQGELRMHAYLPEGWKKTDKRPAIVFFCGGGWKTGASRQFYAMSDYFAGRGLVCLCADYRDTANHKVTPDKCVEDCRSAMRYVRKHAAELGVNPDRLISAGGSAGGHLAACMAVGNGPDAKDDDLSVSVRPQAMLLFNPVLDLRTARALERMPWTGDQLTEMLRLISPIESLGASCPPGIVFFGTADQLLPQGQGFIEKSLALGNSIELWTADGKGHGFFNTSPWQETTTKLADDWLVAHGFLSGPATIKTDPQAVMKKALPAAASAPAHQGHQATSQPK